MPTIADISAEVRELTLRHPFATARDHTPRTKTRPIRVTIRLDDGTSSCAEAVPTPYVTGETEQSLLQSVAVAADALRGQDALRWRLLADLLREALPDACTARAGLEMALHALTARLEARSLWRHFGGASDALRTDITIPLGADTDERVAEARALGFDTFKLKVSSDIDEDLRQLERIARTAPGAKVRLDANQAFQPEEALQFIRSAMQIPVELQLLEQPVPASDLDALARVAAASPVPIYADEAVRTPQEAYAALTKTRIAGINIKLMKSGVSGALDIIAIARAAGRSLMIGCMLEARPGIGFSVAFACGTGAFAHADLDSHLLVEEEGPNLHFREAGPELRPL